MKRRALAATIFTLMTVLTAHAQAGDVTFSGDVAIEGSGNGITFPDGTKQVTANPPANLVLECVTGELRYVPEGPVQYCADPYELAITNPYPTSMDPDSVFTVYCEAPSPYSDDLVMWGLRCRQGWMNTGCTGSRYGEDGMDVPQFMNGCYSDEDEYAAGNIFTTCCRIAVLVE